MKIDATDISFVGWVPKTQQLRELAVVQQTCTRDASTGAWQCKIIRFREMKLGVDSQGRRFSRDVL